MPLTMPKTQTFLSWLCRCAFDMSTPAFACIPPTSNTLFAACPPERHCHRPSVPVQPGDLIIAASDGLWDNARDDEVLGCMSNSSQPDAQQVSCALLIEPGAEVHSASVVVNHVSRASETWERKCSMTACVGGRCSRQGGAPECS
jgi:hypothetical protein